MKTSPAARAEASAETSGMLRLACRLQRSWLRAYPRGFRDDYAEEMRQVFASCARDAMRSGRLALVDLCLRELSELPFHAFREHLDARLARRGVDLMHDLHCPRCHAGLASDARYCSACGHAFVGWGERMADALEPRLARVPGALAWALGLMLTALAGLAAGHVVTARGLYFAGSYALLGIVRLGFAAYAGRLVARRGPLDRSGRLSRIMLAATLYALGIGAVTGVDRLYLDRLMGQQHRSEIALPGLRALTIAHPDPSVVERATRAHAPVLEDGREIVRSRTSSYASEEGGLVTILFAGSVDLAYSLAAMLLAGAAALLAFRQERAAPLLGL